MAHACTLSARLVCKKTNIINTMGSAQTAIDFTIIIVASQVGCHIIYGCNHDILR